MVIGERLIVRALPAHPIEINPLPSSQLRTIRKNKEKKVELTRVVGDGFEEIWSEGGCR